MCLAWGVKLFLYAGNPTFDRKGLNFWETLSQFKVTYTFLATALVDKLEKQNVVPGKSRLKIHCGVSFHYKLKLQVNKKKAIISEKKVKINSKSFEKIYFDVIDIKDLRTIFRCSLKKCII